MQSVHYWSDGKVALSWIKSEAKNWKQCFRNRAEEIHQQLCVQVTNERCYPFVESYKQPDRLLRVPGTCLRFVTNCSSLTQRRWHGTSTLAELASAEMVSLRIAENEAFRREIESLRSQKKIAKMQQDL
ncbi:hypothetical protein D918_09522 [Trichuris suis]|nr:hypothetical protein D918_09522 [Trichuris suis]